MNKIWTDEAWKDYLYWQNQDKKTLKRISGSIEFKNLCTPSKIFDFLKWHVAIFR